MIINPTISNKLTYKSEEGMPPFKRFASLRKSSNCFYTWLFIYTQPLKLQSLICYRVEMKVTLN